MFKFAAKKVWVNNDDDIDQLSLSDSGDDEDLGGALGEEELAPISEMAELPPPPAPSSGGFFNSISSLFSSSSRAPASETTAASIFDDDAAPPMMETMAAPARLRVAAAAPAPPVRPTPRLRKPPRHEEYRSVDTNVFAVALGTLASDAHVLTGDPVICSNCRAAYSQISRAVDNGSGAQCWTCEFCGHAQEVDIAEEERPTEQTSDYLLEPPTSASSEDQLIVFVLDVSGSMCVSSEVQGKIQLRGDHLEKLQRELLQDNGQQWMPGQNRDVTYISRLQGAQAAISQQINALKREHPRSRVALITFASDVTIVGDGSADAITVAGDRLNDFDQLLALGQNVSVAHTIADSHESLDGIIWELQEGGATALGPAATIAVGLASKTPAAKIILCTDGLANVGVGALEEAATPAQKAASRQWYEKLSDIARGFGSSISVVSIAGSGCCMEYLGILADQTSGKVDIVDPLTLTTNFASLLSQPTIASQVTATLLLHKALFIRSGTLETNIAIKEIGNVQANSEVTFEFGVRKDYVAGMRRAAAAAAAAATASQSKIPSAAPVPQPGDAPVPCTDDASSSSSSAASSSSSSSAASSSSSTPAAALPSEVPFQVQVTFRRLDGSKYMRVVTALQPISFDREEVEEDIDMDVLGRNVIQQCADMAHAGEYERAKLHGVANRRFFQKKAKAPHQQKQVADIISVQRQLEGAVRDELKSDDYFGSAVPSYSAAAPSAEVKERRRARRTEADANSNVLYQMKSHSRSPF